MKSKKILIVCDHFSPQSGAQALQATKVADALFAAGCDVHVICGVPQIESDRREYPVDSVVSSPYGEGGGIFQRITRRIRHEIHETDRDNDWVRRMLVKTIEVASVVRPDVIMTQSTPFRTHLIGLSLPFEMRRKWVAYFSDVWPLRLAPYPYRTAISNVFSIVQLRYLERVVRTAQKIIMSSDESIEVIKNRFPNVGEEKLFSVAHIGRLADVIPAVSIDAEHYASRFVHVGRLTRERTCPELIRALRSIVSTTSKRGERFPGFTFVGWVDAGFQESCRDLVERNIVEFVGDVDPAVAQSICAAAGVLVVIEANMAKSPFLPSKFSDYAMLGKPIMAISPPGPVRNFLSTFGGGVAVGHDVSEIEGAMAALLQSGGTDQTETSCLARQFNSSHIAQRYLEIFER
ncbi:glycosyltransferase family protein [Paraburkholderia bannensis]|uniref:hypothetical protein n=1 Tax=Paraburkholderia bannensis TaxID=765414 RepID=UPI002AB17366|nr:hypothetical protein [Paraburkholderia bannensis]